jgi:selenocysteine lyase/cysteine desulfurase
MQSSKVLREINIEKIRAETEGCKHVIHFNNAGSSLMPDCVYEAVVAHLKLERNIGGYEAFNQSIQNIEKTYSSVAKLLNCDADEVAFIENATRAWDMAFYSISFQKGDKILTSMAEYASNYIAYLHLANRLGIEVVVVPNDESGQLSVNSLEELLDEKVKLITVTHIPTQGGLVNPVSDIGKIAKKHNIIFLLDACQSVGQMPLDVKSIGCDLLSGTGRKYLRGPRGTGFLYASKTILNKLEPPFLDLHAATWTTMNNYEIRPDAKRFENWESYVAGRIGLGVAVDYALDLGSESIYHRISNLASQLREKLQTIPGIEVKDLGQEKCGIVTFTKSSESATQIQSRLRKENINVSVSVMEYARLDMENRGEKEFVRASVHYFNTEDEIEQFCSTLSQ